MNLCNGLYLGKEICAVCKDWIIVWDSKYNYMLFNCRAKGVQRAYKRNRMPSNSPSCKQVEYFVTFDMAVKYLVIAMANNGFLKYSHKLVEVFRI